MEENSFHSGKSLRDSSSHRLSETRQVVCKPVLVKKLLADESDDEDDQNQNANDSNDNGDDLDGLSPLSEEMTFSSLKDSPTIVSNTRVSLGPVSSAPVDVITNKLDHSERRQDIQPTGLSGRASIDKQSHQKTALNSYLKETLKISDFVPRNNERGGSMEKTLSGAKRNRDSVGKESSNFPWQPKSFHTQDKQGTPIFKNQSDLSSQAKSYSPDVKRLSHNSVHNQYRDQPHLYAEGTIERSEVRESQRGSIVSFKSQMMCEAVNNDKMNVLPKSQIDGNNSALRHSTSNATLGTMETPMKIPQGSSRPNPCNSHRNIFETPQNKIIDDFSKNPIQTPATIFSHWSQHHMSHTPMQGKILATKESMQTPGEQRQYSKHETPRFYSAENKSIRKPLAETMFSGPPQAPHLPRLQEVSNESSSPQIPKESVSGKDIAIEQKPILPVSGTAHESKENWNPNPCDIVKNDGQATEQSKSSAPDNRCINSHFDSKSNPKSCSNIYYNNTQVPKAIQSHETNQQVRDRQTLHPSIKSSGRSPNSHQSLSSNSRECQNSHQATKTEIRESDSVNQSSTVESKGNKNPHQASKQEKRSANQPASNHTNSMPSLLKEWSSRQQKIITVNQIPYAKLGVLGHGMSCEVVKVQDLSNSEFRAIKCVNLSQMDRDAAQGCLQEICMLDKLKAPCVVKMYSFEIKEPWVYVVMEIGDTDLSSLLKSMLQEKRQIPLTMALYYWTEMLTAVKHIHDNGVIHSDLKPANFLLVRGRLKLIDFGIASSINGDMTSVVKNNTVGTLNYISPEALMDVNVNNDSPNHNTKFKISYKSDVWSLGCILYGLVYGKTPFHNVRQQWAKINAITDSKFKIDFPKMSGTEQVPLILIDVMRKCLQREPKARPTVDDLLAVQYLQSDLSPVVVPKIPDNILIKLRNSLNESEWETFKEALDGRRK